MCLWTRYTYNQKNQVVVGEGGINADGDSRNLVSGS